jgi:ATP-dependent RNA helicase SUPV3L1/SUV3
MVRLLWEVCRIPDFRRLLFEVHVALLREIFMQLRGPRAALEPDWMKARIEDIDKTQGDVDTLITRIASIRTWTYVAHQGKWVRDAARFQEQTRSIEDRLSDALHDALVQRFVERRGGRRTRPVQAPRGDRRAPGPNGAPPASHGSPFAALAPLRDALASAASGPRGVEGDGWIERVVSATHGELTLEASGLVAFSGRALGRLTRGATLLLPDMRLMDLGDLGAGARARLLRRLVAFARDIADELLGPLRRSASRGELSAAGRGLVYQIEQGLGTILATHASTQVAELDARDCGTLESLGVVLGRHVIYVAHLLEPRAVAHRAALCAAWLGTAAPPPPRDRARSCKLARQADASAYVLLGYPVIAGRAVRADLVERAHRAVHDVASDGDPPPPEMLARWLGTSPRDAHAIAVALASA